MNKYKIISIYKSKNGKIILSLFLGVDKLVVNAFVIGDISGYKAGDEINGILIRCKGLSTFIKQ